MVGRIGSLALTVAALAFAACGSGAAARPAPSVRRETSATSFPRQASAPGGAATPAPAQASTPGGAGTPVFEQWYVVAYSFVSPNEGWLVRMRGFLDGGPMQVLHTTDGGDTWRVQYDAMEPIPVAMQFIDPLHGWIVGTTTNPRLGVAGICHEEVHKACNGAVLLTSDGGKTWRLASPTDVWPIEVRFVDDAHGWMLARDPYCFGCDAHNITVLHSDDGGSTWSTHVVARVAGPPPTLAALSVLDSRRALVVAADTQYSTSDAGATWQTSTSPCSQSALGLHFDRASASFALPLSSAWVICTSSNAAAGTDGKALVRTSDGGQTWQLLAETGAPANGAGVLSIGGAGAALNFLDATHGWFAPSGAETAIYRTSDGGHTWQRVEVPLTAITDVQFVDAGHGWLSTYATGEEIARTTDGGAHWTAVTLPN